MSILLVKIVDSRLEHSDGTFFRKQCPYTILLVHNYERRLSKERVWGDFVPSGKNFCFFWGKSTKREEKLRLCRIFNIVGK